MKKWTVTLWRSNPQLTAGGYETTRTVEARTEASAMKKAENQFRHPIYGGMRVLRAEVKE